MERYCKPIWHWEKGKGGLEEAIYTTHRERSD